MVPKYGNYAHPIGECEISLTADVVENDAYEPIEVIRRVQVSGLLLADSPAAMNAKVSALQAAYSANGYDFRVYLPNGTTVSRLTLLNAGSNGGVRITQLPSFPSIAGAGYVTNLKYTLALEARYPVANSSSLLKSFEETLTFEGGGPVYGWLKPLAGKPVKQLLRQNDTYRATQTGSAVGAYSRPSPPSPLWASSMLVAPTTTKRSPLRRGSGFVDYGISWSYQFESDSPLRAEPNTGA